MFSNWTSLNLIFFPKTCSSYNSPYGSKRQLYPSSCPGKTLRAILDSSLSLRPHVSPVSKCCRPNLQNISAIHPLLTTTSLLPCWSKPPSPLPGFLQYLPVSVYSQHNSQIHSDNINPFICSMHLVLKASLLKIIWRSVPSSPSPIPPHLPDLISYPSSLLDFPPTSRELSFLRIYTPCLFHRRDCSSLQPTSLTSYRFLYYYHLLCGPSLVSLFKTATSNSPYPFATP